MSMAKKENPIYAPGELSRVREKLGVTDAAEARRLAGLLGGEVGTERKIEPETPKGGRKPIPAEINRSPRRSNTAGPEHERSRSTRAKENAYSGDDPSNTVKLSYGERVKIDQYSGQLAFEIKSTLQVLTSIFSFFKEPVDYVNPRFVIVRMNEYYKKIENLVTSARMLLPQNNVKRNNQLKKASSFVYNMLNVIRSWNIEKLITNLAELQSHPRAVRVTDFADVLRDVYKPLFYLENIELEIVKSAFKLVYKILYIENPIDAKEKYQDVIRNIITSLADVRKNVQFGLYPLLMKLISDRYITYERFFIERRKRFMAFLNVTENEKLNAADLNLQQIESIDIEALQSELSEEESGGEGLEEDWEVGEAQEIKEVKEEENLNDPKAAERKAKEEAEKAELKAHEQGRIVLEALFPKAGWNKLEEYPDLYPYFADLYSLGRGYDLISPGDPLQQVSVMLHILDDFLIGMRNINFGAALGPDGSPIKSNNDLGDIINNWRRNIEDSFSRDYLPRLSEYCRMLENSADARMTPYAKKSMNELHWIKRLYFLPYYKFESLGPPPFPKQDIIPIYAEIRKLRKCLTVVARGIENGIHAGGAASKAPCNGIGNPWERYTFQIPNPVSKRMDVMLPPERKINATLIFFSLSMVTILDYLVNNDNSWAYGNRPGPLFRSVRNEGITPIFGIDEKLNADQIFKDSLKKRHPHS